MKLGGGAAATALDRREIQPQPSQRQLFPGCPDQATDMNVEILAAIDPYRVAVGKIVKTVG
jgi:hypothetical protein